MKTRGAWVVVSLVASLACGGKGDKDKAKVTQAGAVPSADDQAVAKELAPHPVGLESIAAFNFAYGKGESEFDKTEALLKPAKGAKVDWAAVQAACEATLLKDPGHLEAHYLLAQSLAEQGKIDGVGEHVNVALAGDWSHWGPTLEKDTHLASYLSGPRGAKLKELNAKYHDEWIRRVRKGALIVGRRSGYKPPSKPGVQSMSTRAELFAYDPSEAAPTFVRVTQTGWRLAGWAMAPSAEQLAYVAWSKLVVPAPPAPGAPPPPPAGPPVLAEARVGVMNLLAPETVSKEAKLKDKDLNGLKLQYQPGDKLLVSALTMNSEWDVLAQKTYVIDPTTGDAKETEAAPEEGTVVTVTYDWAEMRRWGDAPGVQADWSTAWFTAPVFRLTATQKTITLPKGELALRESFVWTPAQGRLAFATFADPCAAKPAQRQSSLYVVEAATGKLKFLFKGEGVGDAVWLDEDHLLYEDDKDGMRVYDAAQGKELTRVTTRGGVGLEGVGVASGVVCKARASLEADDGEGVGEGDEGDYEDEGDMPPEEPTQPQ